MNLYNSLTRKLKSFTPLSKDQVGIYTCGPTVYNYVSIGNWRTYVLGDLVVRSLTYLGYTVKYVMNETDVGHLTGDNEGDADTGEDRLEKAAKRENKTAWDVAEYYAKDFEKGFRALNLTMPTLKDDVVGWCKATDHIEEQIAMVQAIEAKGFTYTTSDGIYFDTKKYEAAGNEYGKLSTIDQVKEGARVEPNPEKNDPRDFALWKFSYPNGRDFDPKKDDESSRRHMEWKSPWGLGFPGWHIECSAMAIKYLGDQFDIHIGGEDLKSTHHPNEIAQAEAATGKKPFVKYWLHGAFLQVDGGRMGKSLGNAYTLQDIKKRGYTAMHLRYFYLTGHYRKPLNFTWKSLEAAKNAYERLAGKVRELKKAKNDSNKERNNEHTQEFETIFRAALEDDLNMPKVLAVVWEMIKSDLADKDKVSLLDRWDTVLGINIVNHVFSNEQTYVGSKSGVTIVTQLHVSDSIVGLIDEREMARSQKDWQKADEIRDKLIQQGFRVEDTQDKVIVTHL